METMTIKRNGVYIIFPARENAPIKKDNNVKKRAHVNPIVPSRKKQVRPYIKPAKNIGKKCIHCGDSVWRSDVSYCWDCYKYEHFESK